MESVNFDRQKGQILVQVALMVVVLFAFVALALDGGQIYAGRRRMQNAADAGALAGARAICFPQQDNPVDPEDAAREYAQRNGAEDPEVEIQDGRIVIVTASQTLETFFAGVIGINRANVRAEAAAACGGARSAGGLWPIAFSYETYSDSISCNQEFLVFASDDAIPCAGDACTCVNPSEGITETTSECEDKCDCDVIGPHMGVGNRGWLRLFEPPDGYPDSGCANEGTNAVACWLQHGHPGPVAVGDCVAGKEGVSASSLVDTAVNSRKDDIVNVVLYDRPCTEDEDPETLGGAPGPDEKVYHVAGFGCVKVIAWVDKYWIPECGSSNKHPTKNNEACMNSSYKVVLVEKICEGHEDYDEFCISPSGQTGGELPEELESRSVSLIQWPPPAENP